MKKICVLPMGVVDPDMLEAVESGIRQTFARDVERLGGITAPEFAFDGSRRQYSSELILRGLLRLVTGEMDRVLAVTEVDLFIPMLTFVYGQAQLKGRTAVISTARLRQEFYGLTPNPALTVRRAVKESLHELGHTFGLTHCLVPTCLMSTATTIGQLDAKREKLCEDCSFLLDQMKSVLIHT